MAPYVVAILFGVTGGLALWYWGVPNEEMIRRQTEPPAQSAPSSGDGEALRSAGAPALRYATAWQQGNCDEIIATTWWMQERLLHVRKLTGDEEAVNIATNELCERIQQRLPEGNQLVTEGIYDQYLFSSDATCEVIRASTGRDDLAKPTKTAVWLRITYSTRQRAPRDRRGNPIRSLDAAINYAHDGYILKAGILGNAEIDWDSISLRWPLNE